MAERSPSPSAVSAVDLKERRLAPAAIALAVAAALAGCSSARAVPSAATRSALTQFPSRATYGVVAHYRVYRTQPSGGSPRLTVLQVQTPPSYLARLGAVAVPNARVRYPDGSVQDADGSGSFDAAASAYARRHPGQPGASDVPVRLAATVAGANLAGNAIVFAPSAADEAQTASGAIASNALDRASRVRAGYAFSCNPRKYMHGDAIHVQAGTTWASPKFEAQADFSYYPLFGFCSHNNSFLDTSYVTAVRHWSESTKTIVVAPHTVLGCHQAPNHPLVRKQAETFTCEVRTWYTDADFSSAKPWSSMPDVALWFEAWQLNFLRVHADDAHLTLLNVR